MAEATLAAWHVCEIIFRDVFTLRHTQGDTHKHTDALLTAVVRLKNRGISENMAQQLNGVLMSAGTERIHFNVCPAVDTE